VLDVLYGFLGFKVPQAAGPWGDDVEAAVVTTSETGDPPERRPS
jgi:hypothetical protein